MGTLIGLVRFGAAYRELMGVGLVDRRAVFLVVLLFAVSCGSTSASDEAGPTSAVTASSSTSEEVASAGDCSSIRTESAAAASIEAVSGMEAWVSTIAVGNHSRSARITAVSASGDLVSMADETATSLVDLVDLARMYFPDFADGRTSSDGSTMLGSRTGQCGDSRRHAVDLETLKVLGSGAQVDELPFGSSHLVASFGQTESSDETAFAVVSFEEVYRLVDPDVAIHELPKLLAVSDDGQLFAYRPDPANPSVRIVTPDHDIVLEVPAGLQAGAAFSSDATQLAVGVAGGVMVINLETGTETIKNWDCGGRATRVFSSTSFGWAGTQIVAVLAPSNLLAPVDYDVILLDPSANSCSVIATRVVDHDFGYGSIFTVTSGTGQLIGLNTTVRQNGDIVGISLLLDLASRPLGQTLDLSALP